MKIKFPKFSPWMAWVGPWADGFAGCRCRSWRDGLLEGSFVDQPDRHGSLGIVDHHRPFVHRHERRGLQPVRSGLPARSQALPAGGAHSNLHRPDRLHHGRADPAAGHWPPGPLLAFHDLLEQAFTALGSDHVRDPVPGGAGAGSFAHLCQFWVVAFSLAKIGRQDVAASTILLPIWRLPDWRSPCCTSLPWERFMACSRPARFGTGPIFQCCSSFPRSREAWH